MSFSIIIVEECNGFFRDFQETIKRLDPESQARICLRGKLTPDYTSTLFDPNVTQVFIVERNYYSVSFAESINHRFPKLLFVNSRLCNDVRSLDLPFHCRIDLFALDSQMLKNLLVIAEEEKKEEVSV